jgi:ABC-type multidrug transport system ATPase subunit
LIELPPVSGILDRGSSSAFYIEIAGLKLPSGILVYLLGPNGSGKSVYLRSLVGEFPFLSPANPSVRTEFDRLRPILIRQSPDENLALGLTVLENMLIWDRAQSVWGYFFPKTRRHQMERHLSKFPSLGLTPDKPARELSGGQKQGLVLLSRIMSAPELLLLDEFTSAIDAQASEQLLGLVKNLAQSTGSTQVIVTHDLFEAARLADLCILFSRGRLFAQLDLGHIPEEDRYERIKSAFIKAWEAQVGQAPEEKSGITSSARLLSP